VTTTQGETTSLELAHYLRVLRRGAWVIVAAVLLGGLASYLYLETVARSVTATTVVNLNVISSDPFNAARSPSGLIDASTETQMASSSAVLTSVAGDIDSDTVTPASIRSNMDASLESNGTVMRVSYTADSLDAAETGADAIAQAYLDYRAAQANTRLQTIVDQLEQRRDALRDDLVRVNTIIENAAPRSSQAVQAASDRQLIGIELDSLSGQINTYLGLDTTGGVVLTAAAENPTRIEPSRSLIVTSGLALGLVIGVLAAFLLNRARRRIGDDYDVRRAGGGEVLTSLTSRDPAIPAADEDLDRIRTLRELLFATMPDDPPVVTVADLTGGGAGPDVAVNLAHAVAETGRAVDLVVADASPANVATIAEALDLAPVSAPPGTSRYAGEVNGGRLTLTAPPRGTIGRDTAASVTGAADAPVTVIAVPQDAAHSSLLAAGRVGHAVVLVVAKGGTSHNEVRQTAKELGVVGATVNGTVLVAKNRKSSRHAHP
jgi:uncharacterized protein involved in exopolysaccharide biosynthesis